MIRVSGAGDVPGVLHAPAWTPSPDRVIVAVCTIFGKLLFFSRDHASGMGAYATGPVLRGPCALSLFGHTRHLGYVGHRPRLAAFGGGQDAVSQTARWRFIRARGARETGHADNRNHGGQMADVFTVLSQDHEEVRRMLAELEKGPSRLLEPARTSWRCARR